MHLLYFMMFLEKVCLELIKVKRGVKNMMCRINRIVYVSFNITDRFKMYL